jgi:folate-binding protein YgfZ
MTRPEAGAKGDTMAEKTPLYDATAAAGATFAEEAGWLLPEHFGDPEAEYRAARESAVVFDVSPRGKLSVAGADAGRFLHNLCTNDVLNLSAGQTCEAFLCTAKARVVGHVWITRMAAGYILDMAAGQNDAVLKHLDHYLISEDVQLSDYTRDMARVLVAGPGAEAVMKRTGLLGVPDLPLSERSDGPLGVPGWYVHWSWSGGGVLWPRMMTAGARPAGLRTYHTLRVEAGVPMFGPDIDENRLAFEANRTSSAISYTKGCYLGQEPIVMARDRGHVNRLLLGLKLSGNAAMPHGSKVLRDGTEVGQTTSSVVSPRLGSIALAYLRRGSWEPGTVVEVETAAGRVRAEVAALPFSG